MNDLEVVEGEFKRVSWQLQDVSDKLKEIHIVNDMDEAARSLPGATYPQVVAVASENTGDRVRNLADSIAQTGEDAELADRDFVNREQCTQASFTRQEATVNTIAPESSRIVQRLQGKSGPLQYRID